MSDLYGFTEGKTPLQRGKVKKILDKVYNYTGIGIMSRADFIVNRLENGYEPETGERKVQKRKSVYKYGYHDYEYYIDTETYHQLKQSPYSYDITATEYDYALYLIKNGYTSLNKREEYNNTMKQIETEKQAEEAAQRAEQEERQIAEKKASSEFSEWLDLETTNYNNTEKIEILKTIMLDYTENYYDRQKELLVLIDNMLTNKRCRAKLIEWLHNGNKASIKTFECITGIKLPTTQKDRQNILENIASFNHSIEYKAKSTGEIFYIMTSQGWQEAKGKKHEQQGFTFYVNNTGVTEAWTGVKIGNNISDIEKLIERMTFIDFKNKLQELILKNGISPLYV